MLIYSDALHGGDWYRLPIPRFLLEDEWYGGLPNLGLDNLGPVIELVGKGMEFAKHEHGSELRGSVVDKHSHSLGLRDDYF